MSIFAAILGVMLLCVWHTTGAREPSQPVTKYECRWTDTPMDINGKADESAWKQAMTIDSFRLPWLGKDERAAKQATRAKLLWDREYLYFFAEMEDRDIFADVTQHDGATYTNDVFELFFRPSPRHGGYYEFEVNAANTKLDAFFPKWDADTIGDRIKKGDFHLETRVNVKGTFNKRDDTDTSWSVEGRIPWSDFLKTGGRPTIDEEWTFCLARCDYDKNWEGAELSATAPIRVPKIGPFFHQIDDYAPIVFRGPDVKSFGIEKRILLTKSTVVGSPDPPLPYRAVRAYPNLSPSYPIMVRAVPGTDDLMYITQPSAYAPTTLWRVKDATNVKTSDAVKLFDTPNAGVAYDFTFHPKFIENGYVYIGWNGPGTGVRKNKFSRITRYTMRTQAIDVATAKTIIEWESDGHNGAVACFGTDGFMYVTSGDGTSDSDMDVTGQSTDTLLSKVLRIDVDREENGKSYAIPKDNPFADGKAFLPETWATGTRNPWRIACDQKTGHIWIGNNGQDLWEMAHLVRPRDNYGWSVREGGHAFYESRKTNSLPLTKPTIEHSHSEFRSLTGGLVYYGEKLPALNGVYLYGDYSTGRIWGMKHDGTKATFHSELASPRLQITGFGINTRGELLICDHRSAGESGFYSLVPNSDTTPSKFPTKLSESGLFENVAQHQMQPGVVPYSVNAPFWSDGLHKQRYIALPGETTIDYTRTRGWNFPDRTVIVKSFAFETEEGNPKSRKWIETRFMTKQGTDWFGYTYLWNDAGTDAELIPSGGLNKELKIQTATGQRTQVWHYPSRAECMVCHSRAANFVLGLCEIQMNKKHDYGTCTNNQIRELEHLGLFKTNYTQEIDSKPRENGEAKGLKGKPLDEYTKEHGQQENQRAAKESNLFGQPLGKLQAMVDPFDTRQNLTLRAKSWLHTNCSSCHVESGGGNAAINLEFPTDLEGMRVLDVKPMHRTFDLTDAKLIAPGHPERSVLLKRISLRGPHQMPPLSTNRVDERGVALITEWIQSLKK